MNLVTITPCCCCCLVAKLCPDSLWLHALQLNRLLCPWDSPGKNTGVGCHSLFQEIFPTQGLHPHLLYWQVDSLPLSHLRSPITPTVDLTKSWYILGWREEMKGCELKSTSSEKVKKGSKVRESNIFGHRNRSLHKHGYVVAWHSGTQLRVHSTRAWFPFRPSTTIWFSGCASQHQLGTC